MDSDVVVLNGKKYYITGKTSGPNIESYYTLSEVGKILFGEGITRTVTFMQKNYPVQVDIWENWP